MKKDKNYFPCVYTSNSIKPFDNNGMEEILKKFKKVIIIEENVPHGGLTSRVKCINSDTKNRSQILAFTLKDKFIHSYGTYNDILNAHGLSVDKIFKSK